LKIFFRPGPNNTIVIVVIVSGTTVPNITLPNILNITIQPTPSMKEEMNVIVQMNKIII
jgi:hypothetical protein